MRKCRARRRMLMRGWGGRGYQWGGDQLLISASHPRLNIQTLWHQAINPGTGVSYTIGARVSNYSKGMTVSCSSALWFATSFAPGFPTIQFPAPVCHGFPPTVAPGFSTIQVRLRFSAPMRQGFQLFLGVRVSYSGGIRVFLYSRCGKSSYSIGSHPRFLASMVSVSGFLLHGQRAANPEYHPTTNFLHSFNITVSSGVSFRWPYPPPSPPPPQQSPPIVSATDERVQIDWQWPLSGIHSIMMVNSAQRGEGGGMHALPLSFYLPSRAKLWRGLQLRGQIRLLLYFSSTLFSSVVSVTSPTPPSPMHPPSLHLVSR